MDNRKLNADFQGQPGEPPLRIGISSCLLGNEVRYDGGHKRDRFLVGTLGRWVEWHPLCPEVEIGLGTPRETIRLVEIGGGTRLVAPGSGSDHTETMRDWSRDAMEMIADWRLHGFILKKGSPSCGLHRVRVWNERSMPERKGRGLFADELTRRFPMLPVEEEGRLNDPVLRETFIESLFVYQRWTGLLEDEPKPADLVAFHSAHKLTLLAHDPEAYSALGRLVADCGRRDFAEVTAEYGRGLMAAMSRPATPGRHANVLHHAMGFLKGKLTADDKRELLEAIDDQAAGLAPLVVPLVLLRHHLRKHGSPEWLAGQVYLEPYPKELMLRNHV